MKKGGKLHERPFRRKLPPHAGNAGLSRPSFYFIDNER